MNTIEIFYFLYKEMYNYRQLLDRPTIPKRDFYNMLFSSSEYILGMPSPFLTILTLFMKKD